MTAEPRAEVWPRRILVGVDGSGRSADALAFADVLADGVGASLTLGCIYGASHTFETLGTESEAQAALRAVTAPRPLQDRRVRLLRAASPAEGLRRLVSEEAADVVVIGPSHRSGLGRVRPGAVAGLLMTHAPCAVAVAPHGFAEREDPGLRVTGVGYDGSSGAASALHAAEALALAAGGALRVFCVVPPGPDNSGLRSGMLNRLADSTRALDPGARALPVNLNGGPASELIERSEEVELLMVGTHGRGRARRALLGSVAETVLEAAACPVIVVPGSGPAGEGEPLARGVPVRSHLAVPVH